MIARAVVLIALTASTLTSNVADAETGTWGDSDTDTDASDSDTDAADSAYDTDTDVTPVVDDVSGQRPSELLGETGGGPSCSAAGGAGAGLAGVLAALLVARRRR